MILVILGKTMPSAPSINHLPVITKTKERWYVYHSQMGGLYNSFTHIKNSKNNNDIVILDHYFEEGNPSN